MQNLLIDEDNWILLLKNGNASAFELLYRKHRVNLFANIFKLVKDEDVALDILQDVFTSIWQNREKLDLDKSFNAFLYNIAKNKVYDFFRRASRDLKAQDHLIASLKNNESLSPDQEHALKEDIAVLNSAIDSLPAKCREVFKLCKIEGKSYEEVAEMLNISMATVNNHIVKATKILKKNLTRFHFILVLFLFF